jgi:hypothetical protein
LKESEQAKVLQTINSIRSLRHLKPVAYRHEDDLLTQKAALMIAASGQLDRFPSATAPCHAQEGAQGSGTSNLCRASGSTDSTDAVAEFLTDQGMETLGHRRRLLDLFSKTISFGRVDGRDNIGVALKDVNDDERSNQDLRADYVAYPQEDYPSSLFSKSWYLSFSSLADKERLWNNKEVNFSRAKSDRKNASGAKVAVRSVLASPDFYGPPNCLRWLADGLKDKVRYDVAISGVKIPVRDRRTGEIPEVKETTCACSFQRVPGTVTRDNSGDLSNPPKGDVNDDGRINALNATLPLQIIIGVEPASGDRTDQGDLNGDGTINVRDVIRLLRQVASLPS